MNLVSIIIPMFNEELNIENCIRVLKEQTNQGFDVCFIDDGSKDKTVDRLEEILDSGVQFSYKIIRQSNKGAAAARKIGINHSSTEYIMIFDCDDRLSHDIVDELYRVYNNYNDVDIIIPNAYIENMNCKWSNFVFYTLETQLKPIECVKNTLNGWKVHGWLTVKKAIIEKSYKDYERYNICNNNYMNNDEVITRFIFSNSKNIVRSNAIYYYCYNNLSTTKRINSERYLTIKNALIISEYYCNNNEIKVKADAELIAVTWSALLYMYRHKSSLENIEEWKKIVNHTIENINYFDIINELNLKKKVQLTILKLSSLI